MEKSCFNCKHSYNMELCVLFDDLISETCSCFMWKERSKNGGE